MSAEGTPSETPGHKELTQEQKDLVTVCRQAGKAMEELIANVKSAQSFEPDPRWLAMAKTHFQEGLMCAVRSITKPDFF